ncbi:hypothetical protein E4K67_00085 [Desulfosporosinus fructosivorans]|uniref:Uncharacterized protein n=1 Tax=Desulfosporosinus fructosivorans TaxID=2018669 RepID=A0A4Z0RAI4_9FIRM|nr:hypothetical protein [Desulfosporosinus fructosivorans]TGE39454.1 hypothetical protein E4K67_00085 [Desulfosporosinus fructosivorans]
MYNRVIGLVAFILCIFVAILGSGIFLIGLMEPGSVENPWIPFVFAIMFAFFGFKAKRELKVQKQQKQLKEERGIIVDSSLIHVEGLPIAEKTSCYVYVTANSLVVEGGGITFNLDLDQIRAAEVKTDVEIANIVYSSAAQGIVGELISGQTGLAIGLRVRSKEKRSYTYYLIINYIDSSGKIASLLLEGGNVSDTAFKISRAIQPLIVNNFGTTVQL